MTGSKNVAAEIARAVHELGGCVYYVGGCVRDELLGVGVKDIDIEVHGVTPEALTGILSRFGECRSQGTSFGIYGIRGIDLDIAMPRSEKATGRGHKDFEIYVDPFIGTLKAAKRRDFTVNALMKDVLTGEIIDHFGGLSDMKNKILRHVNDESFAEDALRVLRCAQFSSRLGFSVAPETLALCRGISLADLPKERVAAECEKALLKAEKPSVFFAFLRDADQLDVWFPEMKALIGIMQSPRFHAEGDVWNHTMLVLDEAAKLRECADRPAWFMYSAAVHDLGKASCTEYIGGVWHAYGHESAGLPAVERFCDRLTSNKAMKNYLLNMTALHMKPNILAARQASIKSTNRLFDDAAEPDDLLLLARADDLGRIGEAASPEAPDFLRERLALYREVMSRPYIKGADLVANGIPPSDYFSDILAFAHKLRLACVPYDSALKQTLAYARKFRKNVQNDEK